MMIKSEAHCSQEGNTVIAHARLLYSSGISGKETLEEGLQGISVHVHGYVEQASGDLVHQLAVLFGHGHFVALGQGGVQVAGFALGGEHEQLQEVEQRLLVDAGGEVVRLGDAVLLPQRGVEPAEERGQTQVCLGDLSLAQEPFKSSGQGQSQGVKVKEFRSKSQGQRVS